MVNIKIIIALISFTSSMSYGQNKSLDEKTEIYQIVAKSLKKGGTRFAITPFTRKSILDDFDFKSGGRGLDTNSNKIYNKKQWIDFIRSVDTAGIKDYPLKFNKPQNIKNKQELTFAPIIFSNDQHKALCINRLFSSSCCI